MKAIRVHEFGGPEVLRLEELPTPSPEPSEVLVDLRAIGVNFVDTYHRKGLYKLKLPFTLGVEGAGVVRAVGNRVNDVKPGDRVAYGMAVGSYAESATVPASKIVKLPDGVDFQLGAALMVQGLTAHYLTSDSYRLKPGETALVHAAAGGVGLLLVQVSKILGARVIGTVSTEEKAELARKAGADEVILYTKQDFEAEVKRMTSGHGVEVVYESVGRDTFDKSLNCLKPRGYLVLYGQSSGPVPPLDPQILNAKGSLFLTRPALAHYILTADELRSRARDVFSWILGGRLRVQIGATYRLEEAERAHRDLEGRRTTGKVLLVPGD